MLIKETFRQGGFKTFLGDSAMKWFSLDYLQAVKNRDCALGAGWGRV